MPMIYSSRLKKILHYCLTQNQQTYIHLDTLADILKTSKRTVFRELKDVDKDLLSYGLSLDNKSGQGIRLHGSKEAKAALLQELTTQGIEYINKEERQNLLMFELLHSGEIQKLLHYANLFQVSEATISNDVDHIEPWFHEFRLKINRKQGLGIEVQGAEQDVRRAMTSLLNQTLQNQESYGDVNYLDSQTVLKQIFIKDDQTSIMRLLNQDILVRILDVFHTYQHDLSLDRYAQASYIGLIIHLAIAIERILKKEEIAESEQVLAMIHDDVSFLQASNMAHYLEIEFDIDIPEVEIAFIALHIKGAKITNVEYQESVDEDVLQMELLLHEMLQQYQDVYRMYLLQDEELFHGLLTHLAPTITRLINHLPIYNPLLEQIKSMYGDLFAQTKEACKLVEQAYDCTVSEDEIGFITMHIGASLERMKQKTEFHREVRIGVVCASGIGVSALLSARMQKSFPHGVKIKTLAMEEVLHHVYEDCELLISTFPIKDSSVEVLLVTPLLNSEDVGHIKKAVEKLQTKEPQPQELVQDQSFQEELRELQQLSTNILEILQHFHSIEVAKEMSLSDMIEQVARDHGRDTQASMRIQEDLCKREAMGSILMMDYHFAMLHTKTDGVKHSSIDIYYPSAPTFQCKELTSIQFVIVMLTDAQGNRGKQEVLSVISRCLIENDAFYEAIRTRSTLQVEQQLTLILKEYMNSKLN